jgi:hypothetical protein
MQPEMKLIKHQLNANYEFVKLKLYSIYKVNEPSLSIELTSFLLLKVFLIRPVLSQDNYE